MNTNSTAEIIEKVILSEERTRSWVARKAGFSEATFRRKLAGGADFTISEVSRIAKVLRVKPSALLPQEFHELEEQVAS